MRKLYKKTISILLITMLIFIGLQSQVAYAKTDAEELKDLLNEYEDDLGNLREFKAIVDETYNDLYTATKVDDTLKEKLRQDVEKFNNITGINPLIVSVLDIELNSQIDNLTDENIDDMREEISVIKEWTDAKVGDTTTDTNPSDNNTSNIIDDKTTQNTIAVDDTIANMTIPKAGIRCVIGIISLILVITAGIFVKKYRNLREIK